MKLGQIETSSCQSAEYSFLSRDLPWIMAISLLLLLVGDLLILERPEVGPNFYLARAEGEAVRAPYSYRPLVPFLAAVLPFSSASSLRLITYAALLVAYALELRLLRLLGFSRTISTLSVIAVFVTYAHLHIFDNPYMIDAPILAVLLGLLLALLSGKDYLFAALAGVGVLAHELVLAVTPAILITRRLPAIALTGGAAAMAFLLARLTNIDGIKGSLDLPELGWTYIAKVYLTFGPVWLAVLAGLWISLRTRPHRKLLAFSAFLTAGAITGSMLAYDTPRMYAILQPIALVFIAHYLEQAYRVFPRPTFIIFFSLICFGALLATFPTAITENSAGQFGQLEDWYFENGLEILVYHTAAVAILVWVTYVVFVRAPWRRGLGHAAG